MTGIVILNGGSIYDDRTVGGAGDVSSFWL